MIRYALKCSDQHAFESWFRSAEDFDTLTAQKMVRCPVCGSDHVEKALMAPKVQTKEPAPAPQEEAAAPPPAPAPAEATPAEATHQPTPEQIEEAVAKLRSEVEANSDYVGNEFAAQARKIHEGKAPARAIYGEAKLDDAKALLEDGVPVLPLPFAPKRKMN